MFSKINSVNFLRTAFVQALVFSFVIVSAFAQKGKRTETFRLGATNFKINIYEKTGSQITFVALHHNEQTSISIAKRLINLNGGRLIELESLDEKGEPSRRLKFEFEKNFYSVDPNRIFTDNGRVCENSSAIAPVIKAFADKLLKLMLTSDGKKLRKGEKFLVSLHNNRNIDDAARDKSEKENDLTAFAFIEGHKIQHPLPGRYREQAAGVFISNAEIDEDNFIFLSAATYLPFFASKDFHLVLQKPATKLKTQNCVVDDGSLSVYFGQRNLLYIGVEADQDTGAERQKQMIEAIYQLVKQKN